MDHVGISQGPGPLGPFVEGYRAWLLGRGYSPSWVIRSLIALGHLGRWMDVKCGLQEFQPRHQVADGRIRRF